jgi:putative ABC transport system substrate-binding protein
MDTKARHFRPVCLIVGGLLAALILAACGGDKKEEKKSFTVGILNPNPVAGDTINGFKAEMTARGYTEGENISYIEAANSKELTDQVKTDDLDLLLVVGGTFGGSASNPLTQGKEVAAGKIPIVVAPGSGDPVAVGDAESVAHPGKNITGLLMLSSDVKRFQFFADMLPSDAKRIAVIYDPTNSDATKQLPEIENYAQEIGLELVELATPAFQPESTQQAFAEIPDDIQAIFMLKVWGASVQWYQWAFEHRIPSSQDGRYSAAIPQPLMTYGPSTSEIGTRAANFAAQILKGAKPGGLPMEYPDFILSIDLSVADGIGFDVPETTLNLAQEIVHTDLSVFAVQPTPSSGAVTQPEGSGACAARQKTMAGTYTVCVTAPCDTLLDSGMITYSDRADAANCSTESLTGICATAAFNIYYYGGEAAMLKMGCGFQSGTWSEPQS